MFQSGYGRALPALIQRPSSNVTAARPTEAPPMQGQPNAQDQQAQMMMTLLALLAAGGQMGGGLPGMAPPAAPQVAPMPGGVPGGPEGY